MKKINTLCIVLSILLLFGIAASEVEPNNNFASSQKISLDTPILAKIDKAGDDDWYVVTVPSSGRINIAITNTPKEMKPKITAYNHDYGYIGYISAQITGEEIEYDMDASKANEYYILIEDQLSTELAETYTLTLTHTPVADSAEPNAAFSSAYTVDIDTTVTGTIFPSGDKEWFTFSVDKPGIVSLHLSSLPAKMKPKMTLYNHDYGYIGYKFAQENGDDILYELHASKTGHFYVILEDTNNKAYLDSYELDISFTPLDDAFEPNNAFSVAKSVTLNEEVTGYIFPAADKDWYKITTLSSGRITISTKTVPAEQKTKFTMYNTDYGYHGYAVATDKGDDVTYIYDVSEGQSVYLVVEDSNAAAINEAYVLDIQFEANTDLLEINNNYYGYASSMGAQSIQGTIFPKGDKDFYLFNADSTTTATITISNVDAERKLKFSLYNYDYGYIGYATGTDYGIDVTKEFTDLEAGKYAVVVEDAEGKASLSSYSLTVSGSGISYTVSADAKVSSDTENNNAWGNANLVDSDTTLTGTLSPSGESDWYKSELLTPGLFTVSITNAGSDQKMSVNYYTYDKGWIYGKTAQAEGDDLSYSNEYTYNYDVGGKYLYFQISDAMGKESTSPYSIETSFVQVNDVNEPNHNFAHAQEIILGETVTSYIFPAGEQDWYYFVPEKPGLFTLTTNNVGTEQRLSINYYNADKGWITAKSATEAEDVLSFSYELSKAVPSYFYISEVNGKSSTTAFTFDTVFTEVDDLYEPNAAWGESQEISVNTEYTAYVFPSGEQDWYVVNCPNAGELAIKISQIPSDQKMSINLYNEDKGWITAKTATQEGDDVSLVYNIDKKRSLYFYISDANGKSSTNPYTLNAQFASVIDAYESNNKFGDAYILESETAQAYIFPNGDQDWYEITIPIATTLTAIVDNVPEEMKPSIALYGANKNWITSKTATAEGKKAILQYEVSSPGTYFVVVSDSIGSSHKETYSLSIDGASFGQQTLSLKTKDFVADIDRVFATVPVTIVNSGEEPHAITATISGDDDLPVSFIGPGSEGRPVMVPASGEITLNIGITASKATKTQYSYTIMIDSTTGNKIQGTLTVTLPSWDDYSLSIEPEEWTLALQEDGLQNLCLDTVQEFTITNTGSETISDLSLSHSGGLSLFISPQLQNFELIPGQSVTVKAYAVLSASSYSSSATITAKGAQKQVTAAVTYTAPVSSFWDNVIEETSPGQSVVSGVVKGFICVNHPTYQLTINLPPHVDPTTADKAELAMSFEKRCSTVQPHDTIVYLNNKEIKRWENSVLLGEYTVEIDPADLKHANTLKVTSENYVGRGHFCANAYNSIKLTYNEVKHYCIDHFACLPTMPREGLCTDGVDNDCDGLVDCADIDCCFDTSCNGIGVCFAKELCSNHIDDDNNGLTDCADITVCCSDNVCANSNYCVKTPDIACPDGYTFDETNNVCMPPIVTPTCPTGFDYDPNLETCVFIVMPTTMPIITSDPSVTMTPTDPTATPTLNQATPTLQPTAVTTATPSADSMCGDGRCDKDERMSDNCCTDCGCTGTKTCNTKTNVCVDEEVQITMTPIPTSQPTITITPPQDITMTPVPTQDIIKDPQVTPQPSLPPEQKWEAGEACERNDECITGNCKNNLCCESGNLCCEKTADCEVTQKCDLVNFVCVPKQGADWLTDMRTLVAILVVLLILVLLLRK